MLHHRDLTKGHYCYFKNAICPFIDGMDYYKQTNESRREKLLIRSDGGRIRNETEKEFVTINQLHSVHYLQNTLLLFYITIS